MHEKIPNRGRWVHKTRKYGSIVFNRTVMGHEIIERNNFLIIEWIR